MTHNHPFLARQSVPQLWTSKFLARHCNPNPNPNHNASAMYRKFSAFQQQALNTSKTPTPIPIPGAALQPQPRRFSAVLNILIGYHPHIHPLLERQSVPQLRTSQFLTRHCNPNPNADASSLYRTFIAFQQQALNSSKTPTPTPIPIPGAALQPQPRRKKFCTVKAALNSKNTIITPNKQIVSNE